VGVRGVNCSVWLKEAARSGSAHPSRGDFRAAPPDALLMVSTHASFSKGEINHGPSASDLEYFFRNLIR
jgi:hypothetical protein